MSAARSNPVAVAGVAEGPTRSKIGLRFRALRSLRWNYTRRGVWAWLKGRRSWGADADHPLRNVCPCCGEQSRRGYQRILSEPERVLAEQTALAGGVFA